MRRAARIDENQPVIVAELRAMGMSVAITSAVGQGFPDLVVGWQGRNILVEIKDPTKPARDKELTPDQTAWHGEWRGQNAVCETADDVLQLFRE